MSKKRKILNEQTEGKRIQERFLANNNDAQFSQGVVSQQKEVAKIMLPLTDVLEELQKAGEKVDDEPSKRLQADYYYILGRLTAQVDFCMNTTHCSGTCASRNRPAIRPRSRAGD